MNKVKFQFNPNTGTMERAETAVESKAAASPSQVQKAKETVDMMDGQRRKPNVSMNEGQVIFREISDRDIIQIQDEKTRVWNKWLKKSALLSNIKALFCLLSINIE